jgi:hypothetical protein
MAGLFSSLLECYELERHVCIFAEAFADSPRLYEDDGLDGFLTPAEAASVMEVDEEAVLQMALSGLLAEARC